MRRARRYERRQTISFWYSAACADMCQCCTAHLDMMVMLLSGPRLRRFHSRFLRYSVSLTARVPRGAPFLYFSAPLARARITSGFIACPSVISKDKPLFVMVVFQA